eukprot:m.354698 g.354698  ORF g.354698 m.354698 type:complete len:346 (+) comp17083_c0_seq1:238-1275(+)
MTMGGSYSQPREIASVYFEAFKQGLPQQKGKVVAVTGCTTGLGFVFARTAIELNVSKLLLLNRSSERATKALAQLQQHATAVGSETECIAVECDLQSFASVRSAAEEVNKLTLSTGLDALVNNAGVMALADEATGDGYDVQMQTNHLSHFLLTALVWPALKMAADKKGEARVVNHSSAARQGSPLAREYLEKNGGSLGGNGASMICGGARWERYHQTKLANCVFTYALHDRLDAANSKVKALLAHPGLASSDLQVTTAGQGGMGHFTTSMLMRMSQSAEDGTMGLLRAAFDPNAKSADFYGPPGKYGFKGQADNIPPEPLCTDQNSKSMLWEVSCTACDVDFTIA